MTTDLHRRCFLAASAAALAASACGTVPGEEDPSKRGGVGLGFSLYGMKSLSLKDALAGCAKLGYNCVELALMPGFHADPQKLAAEDRELLRGELAKNGLRIAGLMENLVLLADEPRHKENLARLALAGELAHELAPKQPPLVETVLGGKPAEWDTTKERMVERLASWAKTAEAARTVVAIKGHVGNAAHLPQHVAWLVKEVGSPWLKAAYDYSHFDLRGLGLAESLKTLLPHVAFIHVKDARGEPGKFQFLLPGEGKTDYAAYFTLLGELGYRGDVVVEVSGQISSQPDYEPLAAARKCYERLALALAKAGARRE